MTDTTKDSINVEHEAKCLLNEEEFNELLNYFKLKKEQAVRQTNSFFDTENWTLNQRGVTLRVRLKKGVRELTLKEDAHGGGRLETNYSPLLDAEYVILTNKGILPPSRVLYAVQHLGIPGPYFYQGDQITDRIEISYKGCKLALDYNIFIGGRDHEIEFERDQKGCDEKEVMRELLNSLHIPYRKAGTKRERYFESKRLKEEGERA